jgi:hypothetical protein
MIPITRACRTQIDPLPDLVSIGFCAYDTNSMKNRSRLLLLCLAVACQGCGEGAKLLQQSEHGGVVVYPFRPETGSMTSSFRRDAIRLIEERCGRRYTILREGEAKGRSRVHNVQDSQEVIQERRWGIQFECQ